VEGFNLLRQWAEQQGLRVREVQTSGVGFGWFKTTSSTSPRISRPQKVSFWWCSTLWIITTNAKVARFFVQLSWNMPLLESGKNFCHLPKNVPLSLKIATFRENYTIFTKNCSPSAMRIVPRLCDKNRMPSMLKLFEKFWAFLIYSGSLRRFKLSK
jgi:hypothetical protein